MLRKSSRLLIPFALATLLGAGCAEEEASPVVTPADELDPPAAGEFCLGVDVATAESAAALPLAPECPNCIGAQPPGMELADVQPLSCAAGETYPLSAFTGTTTVVTLLSARCPFCQAQSILMEQMRNELDAEGIDVNFVIVNWSEAAEQVGEFIERVPFPILQDEADINAWNLFQGGKDDVFVYGPDGLLAAHTSPRLDTPYNLSEPEGYSYLRDAIVDATNGIPTEPSEGSGAP
jgi:hypothetical protein